MLHATRRKSLRRAFDDADMVRLARLWMECARAGQDPWLAIEEPLEDDWREAVLEGLRETIRLKQGYVYVAAYLPTPGVHKIGQTAGAPEIRVEKLRTAGVLAPFVMLHSRWTPDRHAAEAAAHRSLHAAQVDREFFQVGYEAAIVAVDQACECLEGLWTAQLAQLGTTVSGVREELGLG